MGALRALAHLLWAAACHSHCRGSTALHHPGLLSMWHASQEDLECTHAHVSWLWRGAGPRSQRSAQYSARSAFVHSRRYRGAHGNRQACPVKRFRTGDLYCWISDGQWQAPWMKEEPPAFAAAQCQTPCDRIFWNAEVYVQMSKCPK